MKLSYVVNFKPVDVHIYIYQIMEDAKNHLVHHLKSVETHTGLDGRQMVDPFNEIRSNYAWKQLKKNLQEL